MTAADLPALAGIPKGLPGESYRHWKRRLRPEEWTWFVVAVSQRLGHCRPRYTFQTYLQHAAGPHA